MSAVLKSEEIFIRKMKEADLLAVRAIEVASYDFPWSEKIFLDCLLAGYVCQVVEVEQKVAGYCIVTRAVQESHVLNICVDPKYRRSGCARQLIENEIAGALENNVNSICLEVRVSNVGAIELYTGLGFHQFGQRTDYYPAKNGREDAFIYRISVEGMRPKISNLNLYV